MDKIYDEYYYKIFYWAIKKTNNREDAEDLTNSIFLAIFEYFNRDIKIDKMDHLIWKIAYNMWTGFAKKYVREKNNLSYDDSFDLFDHEDLLDKIVYKEIINNLGNIGLTLNEKECFILYYLNDLSVKDISNKMNTSVSNIKYYLYRARNKIKERYDG